MKKFGLTLHSQKTRLLEFGRFAAKDRKQRGEGKPETFEFLGFTHICGRKRQSGGFMVKRRTIKKRLRKKLQELRQRLMERRHRPVAETGKWIKSVVRGYFNYHAIPGNFEALKAFRREISRHWRYALQRRSQRHRMNWERFKKIADLWIPRARIVHGNPNDRFYAKHPKQEPYTGKL